MICDATHVNNQADIHAAFDSNTPKRVEQEQGSATFFWVWFNPVDVFRLINLPAALSVALPISGAAASACIWIGLALGAATLRLKRIDL